MYTNWPSLGQSWTKVLRHFTETNAFKLTIIFCVWMKTPFSSVLLPPFPQPMLQTPHGCLFVSNIEKGGRGGYLSWWERGEFTPREKKLVIVVCLNDFCPWLSELDAFTKDGNFKRMHFVYTMSREPSILYVNTFPRKYPSRAAGWNYDVINNSLLLRSFQANGFSRSHRSGNPRIFSFHYGKPWRKKARHSEEIQYFTCIALPNPKQRKFGFKKEFTWTRYSAQGTSSKT